MRISRVVVDLGIADLNEMLVDFLPDAKIRVTDIHEGGIIGQLKLLLWNIDFAARPTSGRSDELSLEIAASKLVPIPSLIVQRSLRDAIKDAPNGIDVIQQSLRVHLPSILNPLGIHVKIRELACHNGFVRVGLEGIRLPTPDFGKKNSAAATGLRSDYGTRSTNGTGSSGSEFGSGSSSGNGWTERREPPREPEWPREPERPASHEQPEAVGSNSNSSPSPNPGDNRAGGSEPVTERKVLLPSPSNDQESSSSVIPEPSRETGTGSNSNPGQTNQPIVRLSGHREGHGFATTGKGFSYTFTTRRGD